MSYSEHYSETISGTEYVEVYHPASETSSSETVSVHWSEDVNIVITVDTSSFDNSVSTIKHHIDGLAGAVIATEAGQIEEPRRQAGRAVGRHKAAYLWRLSDAPI